MKLKLKPGPFRKKLRQQKDYFYYWLIYLSIPSKHTNRKKKVIFYPEMPKERSVLGRIFEILKYQIVNDLSQAKDAQFIVNWDFSTYRTSYPELLKLSKTREVINIHCSDISKKHVDQIFGKIFGYTTIIDPTTFKGKCVKKGDINAVHDGTIVECPIEKPDPEYIYQKLINNKANEEFIEDLRVPVFKDYIPFVYIKNRPIDTRFASYNSNVSIIETEKILSKEEVNKILLFCHEMGLDYGELDVLRDRDDNKIYIIDANNTPGGPPIQTYSGQLIALRRLVLAFDKQFTSYNSKKLEPI
jgi:hypothetical protein